MIDYTDRIEALRERLAEAQVYLRVDELRRRRPQLEAEMARPDLWDDPDAARKVQTELASVIDDLDVFDRLTSRVDDAATLYELGLEEGDDSVEAEIADTLQKAEVELDRLELRALFTGEYDDSDAVCTIKSGAGGTDAQDWAEMLLRMYLRWAERRGLEVEIDSVNEGQEAGITTAEFIVKGRYAYGQLRAEHGVHRLVRMSPFNNAGTRQTAFASLTVAPFFEDVGDEVVIDDKDLRIDVYRSSGAGGQHVNKTDSAVRITHLPTGIVVACQNERSQHQNRERAMQVLKAKLLDLERKKREEEVAAIRGETKNVDFGSQIRSYVLQPYRMVKDLRTGYETGDVDAVLNGEIDEFIEAYLRWERAGHDVSGREPSFSPRPRR
ncbi:MAG TPA: peptide chain release factor 2 [Acidimicrobiales bacterium]